MQESIIQEGVDLMLFGMGTVFVFLTVLVIATGFMSSLVQRFFPDRIKPAPATASAAVPVGQTDPRVLAIIKAAIEQHRGRNK